MGRGGGARRAPTATVEVRKRYDNNDGDGGDEMDNETASQTDRRTDGNETHTQCTAWHKHNTAQNSATQEIGRPSKATGAEVQSPDMLGQGQTLVCYTASVSGLGSRQRGPMAAGGAGGLASLQSTEQGKAACTCSRRGRGIAPPVQSAAGTALASQPGPSWVGMRPRRPLQDVREVREVGKGPAPSAGTWPWYLAVVPARSSCPPVASVAPGQEGASSQGRQVVGPAPAGGT